MFQHLSSEPYRAETEVVLTASLVAFSICSVKMKEMLRIESVQISSMAGAGTITSYLRTNSMGNLIYISAALSTLTLYAFHYDKVFWVYGPAELQLYASSSSAGDICHVTVHGARLYLRELAQL